MKAYFFHSIVQPFTHASINAGRFSVSSDRKYHFMHYNVAAKCKFRWYSTKSTICKQDFKVTCCMYNFDYSSEIVLHVQMLILASSTNFGHQHMLEEDKMHSKMKFKWDSGICFLLTNFITSLTWNNKEVIVVGTQLCWSKKEGKRLSKAPLSSSSCKGSSRILKMPVTPGSLRQCWF